MKNASGHKCKMKMSGSGKIVNEKTYDNSFIKRVTKGLFTWGGGPRSSGVDFFCFHALGATKQKKHTPLDRGPPLHVNRV